MAKSAGAKATTRRQVTERVNALSPEERTRRSEAACRHLLAVPEVREASAVLLYCPLPDELDTWPALRALAESRTRLILPRCRPAERELTCVEVADLDDDLFRGAFGILEPKSDVGVGLRELDVVVTPGRAFDRRGNRVGRGAAYYDRLFSRPAFRAFKCGIAFDCQVLAEVPVEGHDIPMDAVVTESGLVRVCGAGAAEPRP